MHQSTNLNRYELSVIAKIKQHIDEEPLRRNSIENLSDIAGTNRKVLQRNFKLHYSITISEYQLQKRLEAAAQLLEEGRLSKKQIACRCGYHNANNFSMAFRKVYNMSPSEWQRQAAANEVVSGVVRA